jgi:hypothetical protein
VGLFIFVLDKSIGVGIQMSKVTVSDRMASKYEQFMRSGCSLPIRCPSPFNEVWDRADEQWEQVKAHKLACDASSFRWLKLSTDWNYSKEWKADEDPWKQRPYTEHYHVFDPYTFRLYDVTKNIDGNTIEIIFEKRRWEFTKNYDSETGMDGCSGLRHEAMLELVKQGLPTRATLHFKDDKLIVPTTDGGSVTTHIG